MTGVLGKRDLLLVLGSILEDKASCNSLSTESLVRFLVMGSVGGGDGSMGVGDGSLDSGDGSVGSSGSVGGDDSIGGGDVGVGNLGESTIDGVSGSLAISSSSSKRMSTESLQGLLGVTATDGITMALLKSSIICCRSFNSFLFQISSSLAAFMFSLVLILFALP